LGIAVGWTRHRDTVGEITGLIPREETVVSGEESSDMHDRKKRNVRGEDKGNKKISNKGERDGSTGNGKRDNS